MKTFHMTNDVLNFDRSDRGKPKFQQNHWSFNVSHAGNFTVFAAQGIHTKKILRVYRFMRCFCRKCRMFRSGRYEA